MSTTVNATTDRIRLVGLSARGHHGVLPFEREEGQLFTVDVTLDLGPRGTAVAAVTDSLDDAVDYSSVANAVVTVIEGEPVNLLEALADRIAERVLAYPRVLAAEITVHKPQAPLDVAFEDVAMTIYRTSESVGQSAGAHAAEPAEEEQVPAEPRRFTSHRAEPAEPGPAALGVAAPPLQAAPPPAAQSPASDPWAPDQWMSEAADAGAPAPGPSAEDPLGLGGPETGQAPPSAREADSEPGAASLLDGPDGAEPGLGLPEADPVGAFEPVSAMGGADGADGADGAPAEARAAASEDSAPVESLPTGLPVQLPGEGRHRAEPSGDAAVDSADEPDPARSAGLVGLPGAGEPEAGAEPLTGGAGAYPAGTAEPPEGGQEPLMAHSDPDSPLAPEPSQAVDAFGVDAVPASPLSHAGPEHAAAEAAGPAPAPDEAALGLVDGPPVDGGHQVDAAVGGAPAPALGTASPADPPAAPAEPVEPAPGAAPFAAPAPADPLEQRPGRPVGAVFALGANAGHLLVTLRAAVRSLKGTEGIEVIQVGPLARTVAVVPEGGEPQPDYLNTVVTVLTTLSPRELLAVCQALESDAGRVRTQHWGPRTLDVDLVTVEGVDSRDPELTLPHAHAHERAFVLVPWSQADPFAELGGRTVTELAEQAPDRSGLRWLAFDWLDTDNIPEKPTGPYVAPPVVDEDPEPVEQVFNATRNEQSVIDAELAAEYLAGIGDLPPQDAGAQGAREAQERYGDQYGQQAAPDAEAPSGGAPQAVHGPGPEPAGLEADNPFAAASFGTDYAVPVDAAQAPGQAPRPQEPEPLSVPQVGEEDSWEAPLQWNEVIGGTDGMGPRQGS
ncbi:2-amino-4-hydroxy-6-hydroxymethyldihydropteridine diphosphokinase [Actinomyces bowdenii]|uniref:Bifunctional folate synthesis protein n=1 Tax=Actinomyces bowdenii TaxID=131109 RepID=A0A3P1VAR6_9ACTO|nr:2-amino-4-hydroxy-6-hydroxymethyldihydropteridine diphosphokinase [Actinomyces bowdenii]RRD30838.1 2-amino-4-hydroxy-6-hydroxymethyldihydropteridine diphosphokinase [Actinomyces bowdenii]